MRLTIRLPDDLHAAAQAKADAKNTTLVAWIRGLIAKATGVDDTTPANGLVTLTPRQRRSAARKGAKARHQGDHGA